MSHVPEDYIAEAITEHFGERCPDFDEDCACCLAWKQYDDLRQADQSATERERERLSNALDPEIGLPSDHLLRCIHADIEMRGRKNFAFAVSVHHRNIVLSAVANAVRSSSLLTWEEWLEHCGWPIVSVSAGGKDSHAQAQR